MQPGWDVSAQKAENKQEFYPNPAITGPSCSPGRRSEPTARGMWLRVSWWQLCAVGGRAFTWRTPVAEAVRTDIAVWHGLEGVSDLLKQHQLVWKF
ncbi:uncharacterized protein [Alexandromys fortis]|uniref:uncharacterized protein isoform X2 n=1 Tax=Alexandromys fortis TaxID=100897 RepID=UPI002152A7F5|nr:uncharacterized protein LOC126499181 isoform X2 [Microtus fortis]